MIYWISVFRTILRLFSFILLHFTLLLLLVVILSITTTCSDIFVMHTCYILDKKAAVAAVAAAATVAAATVAAAAAIAAAIAVSNAADLALSVEALAANDLGDKCFSKREFQKAIQHFSSAIGFDNTNHVYYSNRSRAYQHINAWAFAAADARKVSTTSTWRGILCGTSLFVFL